MDFQKTIGHEKQKQLFARAHERGQLGHAYALVGEEGIGKTTFAREIALLLGADPILDMFVLGETGSIAVNEARNLQSLLALTPAGQVKVAIIQGNVLDSEAANALLKTLEEPPARSILFLIASNFYRLLPTIASRVQKIVFGRVTNEQLRLALSRFKMEDARTEEIVRLSNGRIGVALRLAADNGFFEFNRRCLANYRSLDLPLLSDRLKIAEQISTLEILEMKYFLRSALQTFVTEPQSPNHGRKLFTALQDIESNVNVKLAMDNLFL